MYFDKFRRVPGIADELTIMRKAKGEGPRDKLSNDGKATGGEASNARSRLRATKKGGCHLRLPRKDYLQIVAPDGSEGSRPARIEQRRRGEENTACRQREEAEKGGKHALNFQFEVGEILDWSCVNILKYLNKFLKQEYDGRDEDKFSSHRRSFSGAIKRHCGAKSPSSPSSSNSSSSSFSLKSNRFYEFILLERSSSATSDIETAIEGAIAHRKKSLRQQNSSTETENEVATCLLTASTVASCALGDPSFAEYDTSIQQEDDRSIHSRKSSLSNKTLSNKRFFL
ncbi:hypothetical protein Nepgr_026592 [Nepenthes gracilis]|uniref:Uncharacterized protein n=1 Tax=Nepenthes gracilis TaxID=150966 RepID=A0AAD3Y281_NEPGR|nr:hypothetical protein Nepgr_026592 [Nepenthes gracilis]